MVSCCFSLCCHGSYCPNINTMIAISFSRYDGACGFLFNAIPCGLSSFTVHNTHPRQRHPLILLIKFVLWQFHTCLQGIPLTLPQSSLISLSPHHFLSSLVLSHIRAFAVLCNQLILTRTVCMTASLGLSVGAWQTHTTEDNDCLCLKIYQQPVIQDGGLEPPEPPE